MHRWRDPLPDMDWETWWYAYIAHALTGVITGLGVIFGGDVAPYFMSIPVLVVARQTLEFLRRNDTPGRDLGQHMGGLFTVLALYVVYRIVV